MSWTIHLRAMHDAQNRSIERVVERCPMLLGRDEAQSVCLLDGDPSVSKVHASVDVRGDRLFVCDVRSTNGTFARTGRLAPDRWMDVGAADAENEIRIGGWRVVLRGRRVRTANGAPPPSTGTVIEPVPFGASQSQTSVGSPAMPALLVSFPAVVDRLSETAHAARLATTALERAVERGIAAADESDRPALIAALHEHYPELRSNAQVAPLVAPPGDMPAAPTRASGADARALASVQELSRWYVDSRTTITDAKDVVAFTSQIKAGIDAFVLGTVQAISGLDAYVQQMKIVPDAAGSPYPRDASGFARAVFDWRDGTADGAAIVRRAFMDLSIHQVAFFNAVCFGIRELLHELAPETIEGTSSTKLARRGFWGRLLARITAPRDFLAAYRRRYADLTTDESSRFALLFGPRFAEEYRAFVQETRASSTHGATQTSHAVHGSRGGTVPLAAAEPRPVPGRGGTVPLAPAMREDDVPGERRP